jgi:hypothetical protein
MADDRLVALEQHVAELKRDIVALRATMGAVTLRGSGQDADELTQYGVQPIPVEELREIFIRNGWDPTKNEASREIIAMRGE